MSTTHSDGLRLVMENRSSERWAERTFAGGSAAGTATRLGRSGPRPGRAAHALLALGALVAVGFAVARVGSEGRAVRALPEEQRHALYAHAIAELRDVCETQGSGGLRDRCRETALLAARLDECRGDCQTLVRHQLVATPTR